MMNEETAVLSGDALNDRLDAQILFIERVSLLLEDAKLDLNDVLVLDNARQDRLMELFSAYESFLEHLRDTTQDTVAAIKGLTTDPDHCCVTELREDLDDVDVDESDED